MYLIKTDKKLLCTLKQAQESEVNYVYINGAYVYCCHGYTHSDIENAILNDKYKKISITNDSIKPSLKSLIDLGLIKKAPISASIYQVTHQGFHHSEIRSHEITKIIINNVLFPIIVSFFTTLVTLCIKGIFK